MITPTTLPQRLYLLAYDPRRQQLATGFQLGYALRAAALIDLLRAGLLADHSGVAVGPRGASSPDPVLDRVRHQVMVHPSRDWKHWIRVDHRGTEGAVRDQLHELGLVDVQRHRYLGLIPGSRVAVPDPQPALAVMDRVQQAADGTGTPDDEALLVLAATAGFPAVDDLRARAEPLAAACGPVVPALRAAIRGRRAAASGGS